MSIHYETCARCDKDLVITMSDDYYFSDIDGKVLCKECYEKEQPKELVKQITDLQSQLAEKERQVKVYAHEIAFLDNKLEKKEKEIEKLEEQLKNAIVPKYKTGDKVYGIIDTWAYTDVFPVEIRDTHLLYEVWDGEDTTKQHSSRIFATKEEAEQKLNELKGKVEDER